MPLVWVRNYKVPQPSRFAGVQTAEPLCNGLLRRGHHVSTNARCGLYMNGFHVIKCWTPHGREQEFRHPILAQNHTRDQWARKTETSRAGPHKMRILLLYERIFSTFLAYGQNRFLDILISLCVLTQCPILCFLASFTRHLIESQE